MIGERRAVQAFLQARPLSRGPLEVELREAAQTSDPRSGTPVLVPPLPPHQLAPGLSAATTPDAAALVRPGTSVRVTPPPPPRTGPTTQPPRTNPPRTVGQTPRRDAGRPCGPLEPCARYP